MVVVGVIIVAIVVVVVVVVSIVVSVVLGVVAIVVVGVVVVPVGIQLLQPEESQPLLGPPLRLRIMFVTHYVRSRISEEFS